MSAYRYPTGDELIDELCEFATARLPTSLGKVPNAHNDVPSLAEDWWVEDRIAAGFVVPGFASQEQGLRAIYRWARNHNVESGRVLVMSSEVAADLLLHQVCELTPVLFGAAKANAAGLGL